MSQQFRAAVVGQLEDLYTAQLEDVTAVPALDEDFQVEYESLYEETCAALPLPAAPHASSQLLLRDRYVGGIYLRLFLQNPQYNIRKPEKFVEVKASRQLAHPFLNTISARRLCCRRTRRWRRPRAWPRISAPSAHAC